MAYTKIFPIRTRLDRRVRYALNGKKTALEAAAGYALDAAKTESVLFTDAFNCGLAAPCAEMYATKRRWGKDQNRVQGYHIIQSFRPGEVTPEQAHEIGCEFARRFLAGRYETVIGTHLDKAHPHNHIVFNACSYADGRMFRNDLTTTTTESARFRTRSAANTAFPSLSRKTKGSSTGNGWTKRRKSPPCTEW